MDFNSFLGSIPHKFKESEVETLRNAFEFCLRAHEGQKRKSGEDFSEHPITAAVVLGKIFPDITTIIATLLHDIPEDTTVKLEEIRSGFGEEVAKLVDGVTKLGKVRLRNSKDENYIENLRKMFIATSQDVRVILVKLADRLHNMRTLRALPEDKRKKIATETLEIFSPIAGRLGIGTWKDELEDLSFEIVHPKEYAATKVALEQELASRSEGIREIQKKLNSILHTEGVKYTEISGRVKRLFSLFRKLKKYDGDISKIYDIIAVRILTRSTADCYAALGIIHKHFQPVPGRIKDFISIPKPNGYKSLHTTVFDDAGRVFEVQLRTDLMDEEAERGIAAHWFYSESGKADAFFERPNTKWIKELRAWQEESQNSEEFLEHLKIDFFQDRIFVLTPRGDVKDLPKGASVIDFAFAVHSDLGYHMMGAKINGKMGSIYDELKQGDVVEIIKSKKPVTISRDWLAVSRSSSARSKIRHYLHEHDRGIFQRVKELKLEDFSLPKFFRKK
ncbi:MAG TPA: RelA/SpoT family protein [Patescibacteria group bacterium]|nr:RelA/SpoT family protein [Patescibacteria group bacterium]